MTDVIKINEASLDMVEKNLIEYLNADDSPFKGYNFKSGALSGFIRIAKFVIRNLSYQLNKSIEQIFLDSNTVSSILYSLIRNYNYIPNTKSPAKANVKFRYNLDGSSYTPDSTSTFRIVLNHGWYIEDYYKFIPSIRDKNMDDDYSNNSFNSSSFNTNMQAFEMTKISNGTETFLSALIPCYQAEWGYTQKTFNSSVDTQVFEFYDTGSSSYYGKKIITESIKVWVKEVSTGTWFEYLNAREGQFDQNYRAFLVDFDEDKGIVVKFDVSHICRTIATGDIVRIIFAKTEGEVINETPGNNVYTNVDIESVQIIETRSDDTENTIFQSTNYGGTVSAGTANLFSGSMVSEKVLLSDTASTDALNLAYFLNGVAEQDEESIKMAAPLFYTTKNRAVTESDFNAILKAKFTEYQDMKAWGGNREYFNITDALTTKIDASSLVYDPATQKYSGTFDDIFTLVTDMLADLYRSGVMTIDNVDYESIVDGKYRPDSGYVYYSAFNKGFKFISSDSDKTEIVSFLDKYKILTIFFKFMDPTFIFIKPTITLSIKSAFQRSVNVQNIQELVKSWINMYVGYNRKIDMKDLNGYLLQQEYIQSVDSISFTATTKVKVPDTITDKVYMRLFNRLKTSPVNLPIYRFNSAGLKIEIGRFTVTSPNNKVKITITGGGIVYGDDNSYNPDKGCFVFTLPAAYAGYKEIFIEGFEFKRNVLSAKREGVIAIENTSDVQIILG